MNSMRTVRSYWVKSLSREDARDKEKQYEAVGQADRDFERQICK